MSTTLPSWTCTPMDGTGVHVQPLRAAEAADAIAAPPETALLAAYLRVVGLLASETTVSCDVAGATTRHEVSATLRAAESWRSLARSLVSGDVCSSRHSHSRVIHSPGLVARYQDGEVRLEYDRWVFDADHVARIGGYLARALEVMAGDPDAAYLDCDLMSDGEREHLLHGRAGAIQPPPDRRFDELFSDVAASRPDAPAIIHNGQTFSYRWLDGTSNAVAHALLARGLAAEDIVAVCAPRGPHWVAAIVGIFKAGGAYLPIEPDWPATRIATLLDQSGCRLVLAGAPVEPGPWAVLPIEAAPGRAGAPGVAVGAEQLAYVYFTSGSTGLPKGAMCEHAGMLNHLLAKIEDLDVDEHSVVVQNAQASFDISLWQAIAPLLVGGRTVIVDRDDILDVRRFLDVVTGAGATVLQLVPSYLDVLLRHTESNPGLGALRCVSVTGEAISKPLVNRFFAQHPGLALVNAYGATEASDDTTHEIMHAPPAEELVPVGRPVRNVTVTVLGPGDTLVPLGAPGEITFSGVCVGRGYVNDPARTAEAFGDDPLRPGVRMYRTGDFGRWLPTGHLEFHGRRDEQVKVSGVRLELGEVEARILEHPRVRAASVVAVPLPGGGKSLAGFYVTAAGLDPGTLEEHLRTVLPAAAVPKRLHPVEALPLNANGKVDKRALIAQAQRTTVAQAAVASVSTPTERRIAEAWAAALGRTPEEIGRDAHFFELGGGSLSALRVVAALGGLITLDGLLRTPVLADLAAAADGGGSSAEAAGVLRLLSAGPSTRPLNTGLPAEPPSAGTPRPLNAGLAPEPVGAGVPAGPRLALVCVPYAAGSAIGFQPLAAALADADPSIAVYGVQPPGHDPARRGEPPLELDELAKLVVEEALALRVPVALWGHSSGVALALECALRLGPTVRHVFVAARMLEPDDELVREIAAVVAAGDAELADEVSALSGQETPADRAFVGRVYRHDTRAANQYLLDAPQRWAGRTLGCPVTVVASTDDPLTAGHRDRYQGWRAFGEVKLAEVDGGGHLFIRTRAVGVATLVLHALGSDS
jgi:amino acid adenylation domain-containing protein